VTRAIERPWLRAPNFGAVVDEAASLHPERTVLSADGLELGYGELDARAGRLAAFVRDAGVAPGEVVALAMGNDFRFVECLLGVLRAGCVALLVNTKLGADTLAYIAGHSEVRLVLGHESLERVHRALLDGAPAVCRSLTMGGERDAYEGTVSRLGPTPACEVDPDELALLMYTSGSTGLPKGVMLSHSNTWWQARSDVRTMLMDWADRGLVMGPLYHANALWAILLPMLYVGGSFVVLPDFEPTRVLEAIDAHGITFMSGTPSMYSLLLSEAERGKYDLSSIELLQCGSAPVPEELLARIKTRFTRSELVETYGLTEGGANVLTPRWGIKKLGSTGLPVPDVEIRVVDPGEHGRECEAGEIGELWTRSPANALGYLKDPERTAERFVGDGWLRTGDLFRRDEQGYCYFCGRTDDMISVGGENVYPKEVETILLLHPAIADVGVVAAPHPVKGEAPVAWVVLKAGAEVTEDEVRQHFLANGPAYAHPRRVFFVDVLPVSSTNKLDRAALQQMARAELPEGLADRTAGAT
jgi:acyl-CoA synthetase (AMP-forming)/AMP-acid ligase II